MMGLFHGIFWESMGWDFIEVHGKNCESMGWDFIEVSIFLLGIYGVGFH